MRTTKPISTICYLSRDKLIEHLKWYSDKEWLLYYAFVQHQPEKNENKEHIHLVIVPNGTIDTDADWFKHVFTHEDNGQRATMLWNSSKLADWILYGIHDPTYLRKKGLKKLYHYAFEDIVTNCGEWLEEEYEMAKAKNCICAEKMIECAQRGLSVTDAMIECAVSFGAMLSFMRAYENVSAIFRPTKVEEIQYHYEFNQTTGECKKFYFNGKEKIYV